MTHEFRYPNVVPIRPAPPGDRPSQRALVEASLLKRPPSSPKKRH